MDWIDEALARGEGFKSEEERKAYFDALGDPCDHPLFADSEDLVDNPMVDAFRVLREEDKSLFELAQLYKSDGNEWMKKYGRPDPLDKLPQRHNEKCLLRARECYRDALGNTDKALMALREKLVNMQSSEKVLSPSVDATASSNTDAGNSEAESQLNKAPDASASLQNDMAVKERPVEPGVDECCNFGNPSQLKSLKAALLANLGLVAYKMKNLGTCCKLSEESIALDETNFKVYLRYAKALECLRKFEKAAAVCGRAISAIESTVTFSTSFQNVKDEIVKLQTKCTTELGKLEKQQMQLEQQNALRHSTWATAWHIAEALGTHLGYPTDLMPPQLGEHGIPRTQLVPAPAPAPAPPKEQHQHHHHHQQHQDEKEKKEQESGTISLDLNAVEWPLLFLYPQHNQLDVVHSAGLADTVGDHLQAMFPDELSSRQGSSAPWDTDGSYRASRLRCYLRSHAAPPISSLQEWIESCEEHHAAGGLGSSGSARAHEATSTLRARAQSYERSLAGGVVKTDAEVVWFEIDHACSLATVLMLDGCVTPAGVLVFTVYTAESPPHLAFIKQVASEGRQIALVKVE